MEDIHSCRRSLVPMLTALASRRASTSVVASADMRSAKRRRMGLLLTLSAGALLGVAAKSAIASEFRRTPVENDQPANVELGAGLTIRLPEPSDDGGKLEWFDFDQLLEPSVSEPLEESSANQRLRFVFEPASSPENEDGGSIASAIGNIVNRTPGLQGSDSSSGQTNFATLPAAPQPAAPQVAAPQVAGPVEKVMPPVWNVYITNPVAPAPVPPVTVQPAPISIYNVPPTPEPKVDEVAMRRKEIGAKVSEDILGKRIDRAPVMPTIPLSEAVTAVQLLRECEEKALSADRLLKRGASFAAREDAIAALGSFAAAKDLQSGGRTATDAFDAAINAMREAGDFLGRYGSVDQDGLARMVASHETEILKDTDIAALTPHSAADMYLDYARMNLTYLVSGHAQGARLLLLLANAEKDRKSTDSNLSEAIAITCMRAAVGASPDDPLLASELGFHALRAGHLGEARWALERSVAIRPSAPALQNLAETYRLAGNTERARQIVASLPQASSNPDRSMLVTTVSAGTFAQLSPPVQTQGSISSNYLAMKPTAPQQTIYQANTPTQAGRVQSSPVAGGQPAALGFNRGPQPPVAQPVPQNVGPSVLDRMATAVKGAWR